MYFYPSHISQEAVQALQAVGLEFKGDEMFIPNEDYQNLGENEMILRGVHLVKKHLIFRGHLDAPKTYSTLYGDMVPTGQDLNQCRVCGYWMGRKMSFSDEMQHERSCRPQYEWRLAR